MTTLRRITAAIDAMNERIGAVIRWMALAMVLIGAIGAVLRYFARGLGLALNLTPWIEAQWYLFSVIFLMGAAYGLHHDAHVRVDVMYERVSVKTRAWIDLVGTFVFLIPFSLMMLYVTFPAVKASWDVREVSPDPGGLPRWPIKALILVSFVLLLLQALVEIVRRVDIIRGVETGEATAPEPEVHV